MNLTSRILTTRKDKKLSQQALATMIGISRSALAQWETEMSSPSLNNLRKMAKILEVSFEWLATGRGNQYIRIEANEIDDQNVHTEIIRGLNKINLRKKRAILNIINAIG